MELRGIQCVVEPFSTTHTTVNSPVAVETLSATFHAELVKHLARFGLVVSAANPAEGPGEVEIEGDFVQFDEGSRWQRYFLTFMSGGAAVEVEGRLYHRGTLVGELYARTNQGIGLLGGSGKKLLNRSAAAAGRLIAGQVVAALQAR